MKMGLNRVYLGLGSNMGNRKEILKQATKYIETKIGSIHSLSSFTETAPMGFISNNYFLNGVAEVLTTHTPREVLALTQEIEKELGRTVKSTETGYQDRLIDIDILLFNQEIIEEEGLIIPHPQIQNRHFVLIPLLEIAPHYLHPKLHLTVTQLAALLPFPK